MLVGEDKIRLYIDVDLVIAPLTLKISVLFKQTQLLQATWNQIFCNI